MVCEAIAKPTFYTFLYFLYPLAFCRLSFVVSLRSDSEAQNITTLQQHYIFELWLRRLRTKDVRLMGRNHGIMDLRIYGKFPLYLLYSLYFLYPSVPFFTFCTPLAFCRLSFVVSLRSAGQTHHY